MSVNEYCVPTCICLRHKPSNHPYPKTPTASTKSPQSTHRYHRITPRPPIPPNNQTPVTSTIPKPIQSTQLFRASTLPTQCPISLNPALWSNSLSQIVTKWLQLNSPLVQNNNFLNPTQTSHWSKFNQIQLNDKSQILPF